MNGHSAADGEDEGTVERLVRVAGRRATPDPAARERARSAARDAWRETLTARERRRRFIWMAPALAAATVILGIFLARTDRQPVAREEVASLIRGEIEVGTDADGATRAAAAGDVLHGGETIATAPGATSALRLAGGGELRMNAGTTLRLVSIRRIALDHGQIYVDTGAPSEKTLVIETPLGLVRDIGTRFDVQLLGDRLRIRIRDGAISLDGGIGETRAGAGQQLLASGGGSISVAPAQTYGADWDWISRAAPPFAIEGSTLESFLGWIERESGRSLMFENPDVRRRAASARLHGSIDGLTPEEALEVVLPAAGLSHRIARDRIVIQREERRR